MSIAQQELEGFIENLKGAGLPPNAFQTVKKRLQERVKNGDFDGSRSVEKVNGLLYDATEDILEDLKQKKKQKENQLKQQKQQAEDNFVETLSKTIPEDLVKAIVKEGKKNNWNVVEDTTLLLKMWTIVGKPGSTEMVRQSVIDCCTYPLRASNPEHEKEMLNILKRMIEFYRIEDGLQNLCKFSGAQHDDHLEEKWKREKELIQKIKGKEIDILVSRIADGSVSVERAERLFDIFEEHPAAIVKILDGADEQATAVEFGIFQLDL